MLSSRENIGFFLGFIGVVLFGGTLPFTKLAVAELNPWFVSAGRAVVAASLAIILLAVLRRRIPWQHTRLIAFSALMVCGGFPVFMGLGIKLVPASHGGVVLGVMPLMTAAVSAIVNKERPSLQFWLAACAGAVLVVGFSLRDGGGRLELGDFYLFMAAICTSFGYVYLARLSTFLSGWEAISWCCIIALPITVPVAIYMAPAHLDQVSTASWIGFAYVSLISMFIGFFAWNAGLVMAGVARVSQVQLLQTFVTLAVAIPVNGEKVDVITWGFAVAVVATVLIGKRAAIKR